MTNNNKTLWHNCRIATMQANAGYGLIDNAALVAHQGKIEWLGPEQNLPAQYANAQRHNAGGALITPGLIDCHTHLVYGGNRAAEFERRLSGESYESIARSGGGIASTVNATRAASAVELLAQSQARLNELMNQGVTTIEIKSGYGLSLEHERKQLQVARQLGSENAISIVTTFLGAHAIAPELQGHNDSTDRQIEAVIAMLPILHAEGLVDAVDVFCERIAFSLDQTERVFKAAIALNIPVKLHAEQLSDSSGAALAARYGALSCDHLEWLSENGASVMASAGTVAVLLPGAFYFLRETKVPPIELLREHKIPIAISTDCNPGSSPCTSLLLMLNMASTLFKLTPQEALAGVTRNAAVALGLSDRGTLEIGKRADLVLWNIAHPAQLSYAIGANPCQATVVAGKLREAKQ